MRTKIDDFELEQVTGGTVVISNDKRAVGFSTTKEKFSIADGVTPRQVRDFVDDLIEANPTMGNAQFDALAKAQLKAKGWI